MENFQLRISVLNVPGDLSPLKLRGWLQHQAQEIQTASGAQSFVQIKLFLTARQRFGFAPDKLDKLLKAIVDGYSAIHLIELVVVENELTPEEMHEAAKLADVELQEMAHSLDKHISSGRNSSVH